MKANVEQKCERKQMFEEKKSRLAKAEGMSASGDSEHRRSGCGEAGNKAACSECGNAYRFKDQCAIWMSKKKIGLVEDRLLIPMGEGRKARKEM